MHQLKKGPYIVILTILLVMVAYLSFFAACMPKVSDSEIIAEVQILLPEIKDYNYGQSRESLSALRGLVAYSIDSPDLRSQIEKEMITFLGSDATFAGKQFICEQLSVIGTEEAVPALAEMLSDEQTADIALYALQRIPDTAAEKALRESLAEATRKVKIGIINTLGERKDRNAVGDLEKLIFNADLLTAQSAVVALGKIADENAANALETAKSKTSGEVRGLVLDAYLRCADNFFEHGNIAQAESIYRELYDNEDIISIRAAALRGRILTNIKDAPDIILSVLKRDNRKLQSVAIGLIRELPGTADLKKIIAESPNLSDQEQIQLLTAFADRNETAARQAVLNATKHQEEAVRVAALTALAKVGNESDIALLVQVATEAAGTDRETAQRGLDLLRGANVDQKIIMQIPNADSKVKAELVRSIGQRNAVSAINTLLKTAVDPDQTVRRESFKSLAIIAQPEYINELIHLLIEEENSGIRNEAERTVVLVSQKIQEPSSPAGPVLNVLPSVEDNEAKSSLVEVLGRIGDKSALPALRNELQSENPESQEAAIHALSAWPDVSPLQELLNVVNTSDNETHKILALRGYINLLKIRSERPDTESIKLYLTAMGHATEVSEKRMVLSGLGTLRSMEALEVTAQYLNDPTLKPEAEAAVMRPLDRIRDRGNESIKQMLNEGLRETLNEILKNTDDSRLREWVSDILERGK